MAYAEGTTVNFDKSIAEIISLLRRNGAKQIAQVDDDASYAIQFSLADRVVRFCLPLPALEQMPMKDGRGSPLNRTQRDAKLAQARRQRGRALLLVIKAKLESVESGIETVEQAFLAHIVMPADRLTVHERIQNRIALEYRTGTVNQSTFLLPAPPTGSQPHGH